MGEILSSQKENSPGNPSHSTPTDAYDLSSLTVLHYQDSCCDRYDTHVPAWLSDGVPFRIKNKAKETHYGCVNA